MAGAFGPPALAVTGRLANGWIPLLAYMPTGEIPAMRRRIDAAAEAVGRRPDEICGILNVSIRIDPMPNRSQMRSPVRPRGVSQLRDLLRLGFTGSNFIASGPDRKADMQRIAEEVLPVLRSAG